MGIVAVQSGNDCLLVVQVYRYGSATYPCCKGQDLRYNSQALLSAGSCFGNQSIQKIGQIYFRNVTYVIRPMLTEPRVS